MPKSKASVPRGQKKIPVSSTALFEKLLREAGQVENYQLRLYITGTTPRSARAIANIRALCDEYLAGHYDLQVIDIYQQPNQAAQDQIIAAPTLVKELPIPARRLIGDFSDRDKIIVGLDLKSQHAPAKKSKTRWIKLA